MTDHIHLTGRYRGAAHNNCNMEIGMRDFIPVFIHILSNYDAHLFIKQFGKLDGRIRVIPQTDEKYISISQYMKASTIVNKYTGEYMGPLYKEMRFLDSFRFMASSLDKLSKHLTYNQVENLRKFHLDKIEFELLKRKGVYPYEWMDDE